MLSNPNGKTKTNNNSNIKRTVENEIKTQEIIIKTDNNNSLSDNEDDSSSS